MRCARTPYWKGLNKLTFFPPLWWLRLTVAFPVHRQGTLQAVQQPVHSGPALARGLSGEWANVNSNVDVSSRFSCGERAVRSNSSMVLVLPRRQVTSDACSGVVAPAASSRRSSQLRNAGVRVPSAGGACLHANVHSAAKRGGTERVGGWGPCRREITHCDSRLFTGR